MRSEKWFIRSVFHFRSLFPLLRNDRELIPDLSDHVEFEKSGSEVAFGIVDDLSGLFEQISFEFLDHVSALQLDLLCQVAGSRTGADIGF